MELIPPSDLRRLRQQLGLSQDELAAAASLSRVHLSRLESGLSTPTFPTLQRLTRALMTAQARRLIHDLEQRTGQPIENMPSTARVLLSEQKLPPFFELIAEDLPRARIRVTSRYNGVSRILSGPHALSLAKGFEDSFDFELVGYLDDEEPYLDPL